MEAPLLLPIAAASPSSSGAATAGGGESSSASTGSIVARVVAVLAVAAVSLFAQHEAARGFRIDVINDAPRGTVAGRRFDLHFVSNGRAERILHYASRAVEEALFPDPSFPRKRVTRVTLKLAGHNLTADAAVADEVAPGDYVISLSPNLMRDAGDYDAVARAVRRGVARMWIWDGRGAAPARVTDAMVDYLASGGAGDEDSPAVADDGDGDAEKCMSARFLGHLERRRRGGGFVARLNRAMRDRWSDAAVDAALGVPSRPICAAFRAAATATTAAVLTQQQPAATSAGDRVAM
uniref:Uncharacterized protein n=1 Tax=Leersia perrieri TaxID=77586 RepID=A0A0D9WK89_9ORYZ